MAWGKEEEMGVSIFELLITLGIITLIALIAIPALMDAHQRAIQKETMANMKTIASALGSYMVDCNHYPINLSLLTPKYIKHLPQSDGWGHPWVYDVFGGYSNYSLSSGGRDGGGHATKTGPTTNFNDSITIVNGIFVAYPEGTQAD